MTTDWPGGQQQTLSPITPSRLVGTGLQTDSKRLTKSVLLNNTEAPLIQGGWKEDTLQSGKPHTGTSTSEQAPTASRSSSLSELRTVEPTTSTNWSPHWRAARTPWQVTRVTLIPGNLMRKTGVSTLVPGL